MAVCAPIQEWVVCTGVQAVSDIWIKNLWLYGRQLCPQFSDGALGFRLPLHWSTFTKAQKNSGARNLSSVVNSWISVESFCCLLLLVPFLLSSCVCPSESPLTFVFYLLSFFNLHNHILTLELRTPHTHTQTCFTHLLCRVLDGVWV